MKKVKDRRIHFKETKFGFEFGSASIERTASFPDGSVVVTLHTPSKRLEVRVTNSGLIRVSPLVKYKNK